ncbi:hypothetical protein [Streptomyces goshikiensis]|uniref:hypothetical protein n=1 Tax=Streptomyces goshikiensis TaxID=1942 RepID=UPI00369F731B
MWRRTVPEQTVPAPCARPSPKTTSATRSRFTSQRASGCPSTAHEAYALVCRGTVKRIGKAIVNRTLMLEHFSTSPMPPGNLVVASDWVHPHRGAVTCPAGILLYAELRREGWSVSHTPLDVSRRFPAVFPGHVCAVSWVAPNGSVMGFAVASAADDAPARRAVHDAVMRWTRLLRTRRVLLAGRLRTPGSSCCGCSGDGTPAIQSEFLSRPLSSCPAAQESATTAARFASQGDTVLLIAPDPPGASASVPPLLGSGGVALARVSSANEAEELCVADPGRLSFVVQPGSVIDDCVPVIRALRGRFPLVRGQHPDQWCYGVSDREDSVRSVAEASDVLLLVGEENDPHALRLAAGCSVQGRVVLVRQPDQLRADMLDATTIGLVSLPSAGVGAQSEMLVVLGGLGPLSIADRRVTTTLHGGRPDGHRYVDPGPEAGATARTAARKAPSAREEVSRRSPGTTTAAGSWAETAPKSPARG